MRDPGREKRKKERVDRMGMSKLRGEFEIEGLPKAMGHSPPKMLAEQCPVLLVVSGCGGPEATAEAT